MSLKISLKDRIGNNMKSYVQLVEKATEILASEDNDILIDMSEVSWFSANLCPLLGMIFSEALSQNKRVRFIHPSNPDVKNTLISNGFGNRYFNMNRKTVHSAIPFKKFNSNNVEEISTYLETDVISRPELSDMDISAKTNIRKTLFEIFENARAHSGSPYVYACGQIYPKKRKIAFTIVNSGDTIKENVYSFLDEKGIALPDLAIKWAVIEENSTKKELSGGFGLSFLQQFVLQNNGKLQIYSDNEFWELNSQQIHSRITSAKLSGTLVNLEIRIQKNAHYFEADRLNYTEELF